MLTVGEALPWPSQPKPEHSKTTPTSGVGRSVSAHTSESLCEGHVRHRPIQQLARWHSHTLSLTHLPASLSSPPLTGTRRPRAPTAHPHLPSPARPTTPPSSLRIRSPSVGSCSVSAFCIPLSPLTEVSVRMHHPRLGFAAAAVDSATVALASHLASARPGKRAVASRYQGGAPQVASRDRFVRRAWRRWQGRDRARSRAPLAVRVLPDSRVW